MSVRILVGNGQSLVLDALASALRNEIDFKIVGVAPERDSVLQLLPRTDPRIVVLGAVGTGACGLELATDVLGSRPGCGVVILAPHPNRPLWERAVRSGVLGVVDMDASVVQLVGTIRGVAVGCPPLQATARHRRNGRSDRPCRLTDREREVLRLTWTGASVQDIARELCLVPGTVRNVSSSARAKVSGRNRFDAARIAQEQGWL